MLWSISHIVQALAGCVFIVVFSYLVVLDVAWMFLVPTELLEEGRQNPESDRGSQETASFLSLVTMS